MRDIQRTPPPSVREMGLAVETDANRDTESPIAKQVRYFLTRYARLAGPREEILGQDKPFLMPLDKVIALGRESLIPLEDRGITNPTLDDYSIGLAIVQLESQKILERPEADGTRQLLEKLYERRNQLLIDALTHTLAVIKESYTTDIPALMNNEVTRGLNEQLLRQHINPTLQGFAETLEREEDRALLNEYSTLLNQQLEESVSPARNFGDISQIERAKEIEERQKRRHQIKEYFLTLGLDLHNLEDAILIPARTYGNNSPNQGYLDCTEMVVKLEAKAGIEAIAKIVSAHTDILSLDVGARMSEALQAATDAADITITPTAKLLSIYSWEPMFQRLDTTLNYLKDNVAYYSTINPHIIRQYFQTELMSRLISSPYRSNESRRLSHLVTQFRDQPELIPLIVASFWREPGSGEMPFLRPDLYPSDILYLQNLLAN